MKPRKVIERENRVKHRANHNTRDWEHYFTVGARGKYANQYCCNKDLPHGRSGSVCEISSENQPSYFAQVDKSDRGCYHFEPKVNICYFHARCVKFRNGASVVRLCFCCYMCDETSHYEEDHNSFIVSFLTNGKSLSFRPFCGWRQWHRWPEPDEDENELCRIRWLDQGEIDGVCVHKLQINHGLFVIPPLCFLIQAYTQPLIQKNG